MQVECFPDAPADWLRGPIDDFADVAPRYRMEPNKEYPFVEMASVAERFGGIQHFTARKLEGSGLARFKLNDILFGKITPCAENGKVALVESLPGEHGLGSTEFIVLSPREGHEPRYLFALLSSGPVHGRAVSRMEGSTGRLRITEDTFTKWLRVAIPHPSEQRSIAGILEAADNVITATRGALDQARRVRDGLVADLLSHGIGPDGRLRNPVAHPAAFAPTALGRVPVDWSISSVGSEFEIQTGFTLNVNRRPVLNRRRYLRVANVQRARLDLSDVAELEAREDEFQKRQLLEGDLLVVEGHADSMQIGRCAMVTEDAAGMTFQNHLYCLRPRVVEPDFGCLWLNSTFARRYWRRVCSTTSGLNTINQQKLKRMPMPVPGKEERERICQLEKAASELIEATKCKLDALLKLKRGLMQDLLTGNVRVPATLEVAGA